MVFFLFFFFLFFLLPKFWLSYSMKKGDKELVNMPLIAEEFGKLILKENDLTGVKIEETQAVDHYDLNDRTVRVKEGRLEKKSLTS